MSTTYYTTYTPSYYYVAPIISIISTIVVITIICRIISKRKRQISGGVMVYGPPGSTQMQTLDQWERKVGAEVEERAVEADASTNGTPIYFSRHIYGGVAQSWKFLVHGTKYELLRDGEHGVYTYNVAPCTVAQLQDEANLAGISQADLDGCFTCLIGWNGMTEDKIIKHFDAMRKEYGQEACPIGRGGKFLQGFSSRIITLAAMDRRWLMDNCQAFFNPGAQLPRPPTALISARLQSQQQMRQLQHDDQTLALLLHNMGVYQQLLNRLKPAATAVSPPSYTAATSPMHSSMNHGSMHHTSMHHNVHNMHHGLHHSSGHDTHMQHHNMATQSSTMGTTSDSGFSSSNNGGTTSTSGGGGGGGSSS